jgi:hypothetical protein
MCLNLDRFSGWTGLFWEKACFAGDTQLLLYNGETKMAKDIGDEDLLMGDDGSPRHIIQSVEGFSKLYKIEFCHASPLVVTGNHILCLKPRSTRSIHFNKVKNAYVVRYFDGEERQRNYKIKNDPARLFHTTEEALEDAKEFYDQQRTRNFKTKDEARDAAMEFYHSLKDSPLAYRENSIHEYTVEEYLKFSATAKKYWCAYRTGLDFDDTTDDEITVDPYYLGAWFGDGTAKSTAIANNHEAEVVAFVHRYAKALSMRVSCSEGYMKNIQGSSASSSKSAFANKEEVSLDYYSSGVDSSSFEDDVYSSESIEDDLESGYASNSSAEYDGKDEVDVAEYDLYQYKFKEDTNRENTQRLQEEMEKQDKVQESFKMLAESSDARGNKLLDALRRLGVTSTGNGPINDRKHIPDAYKFGSRKVRLLVLAGLTDTDAIYDQKNNCYEFAQSKVWHESLFHDFVFIARSLGFTVTTREWTDMYVTERVDGSITYPEFAKLGCRLTGPLDEIPCLLARKKSDHPNLRSMPMLDSIKDVTQTKVDKYYGFEVDGNKRFLRNDFMVVHNSGFEQSMAYV